MQQNVGATDRTVRIGLGALAGVVSLGSLLNVLSLPTALSPVLGVAAIMLLATGFMSFCGLYAVLGVDTCPTGSR